MFPSLPPPMPPAFRKLDRLSVMNFLQMVRLRLRLRQ